ncbi:hypothetical protein [Rhizobium straminoryzae]|uniref:Uncharacterized protein n=1 Tax=Rhizobium straminoryzae TaxID=1387186 RepID=A0A549T855_9HYPH|nr:hypothetical protein [Rhizobium straminoryzae]TRL38036.1 hypothetical protein FNA46_13585 [Rhizobium straminoryzae]
MFKLVSRLAAWWPVTVLQPDPDQPGAFTEFGFEARFLIVGKAEMRGYAEERDQLAKKLLEAIEAMATADDKVAASDHVRDLETALETHDDGMFHRLITDWRGVVDEADQPIPFSAEALDMALDHERIRRALRVAYDAAISEGGARLGNSVTLPAAGP